MTWRRVAPAGAGWALAALLATVTILANQNAAPAAGQISGTIKSAADDKPIARARIVAQSANAEPYVTLSGADGRYVLSGLPLGSYRITVTRTGYVPRQYGEARNTTPAQVNIAPTWKVTDIDVALEPGRHIAGRILDEDGTPFAGAIVEALTLRADKGGDTLVAAASARTDDRGSFRLHGLLPGEYFVSAADPAFGSVTTRGRVVSYSPTYYPGVAAASDAKPVVVPASGDTPPVEFRLKLVPPARVSGRLVSVDGRELVSAAIVMTALDDRGAPAPASGDPSILPDGRFSFEQVPPGRYEIRARGQTRTVDSALFALFSVVVDGSDVNGITMTLHPGAVIEGSVAVEARGDARPAFMTSLRVRAPSIDGSSFGDALTGTVQSNGSFALRGVITGPHQIVVDGLPPPWTLKQVLYRGIDVTDRIIDVAENEQVRGVRVTITDVGSVIDGVVHDAANRPVANAGVLVFARAPLFWMPTNRRMRAAYTDAGGRFSIAGLPAGDYLAVASMAVGERDLARRDRLRSLEPLGTPLHLESDAARAALTLTLAR
jgi:hypothetical protein